jgi:ATP-dependent DNA helicase RecQ
MDLESLLRNRFGHPAFRGAQSAICAHVAAGGDALVVMPTGAGKSICYQLPALARGGTTLVVSPLLALMKDQVDALVAKGVRATAINSSISTEERKKRMAGLRNGAYELVYVAPERFTPGFIAQLQTCDIRLFAIDEAHCLSQWGHDFRPDYLRLGNVRRALQGVCTIALTATATVQVQDDIARTLGIEQARRFVTGFDRKNLHLEVIASKTDKDKLSAIPDLLHSGASLIYCATRKNVEKVVEYLRGAGVRVGMYHAGMDHSQRIAVQDAFMTGITPVVVATNAFGMGVDKDNVRTIVHYDLPGTVEAYYQEIGRAGRDGKDSRVVLLFRESDRKMQEFLIQMSHPPATQVKAVWKALSAFPTNPVWATVERIAEDASKFGNEDITDRTVSSCLSVLRREGRIRRLHSDQRTGTIALRRDRPGKAPDGNRGKIWSWIQHELAQEGGGTSLSVRPDQMAEDLGLNREQLAASLRGLEERRYLEWVPPEKGGGVELIQAEAPLELDEEKLKERRAAEYAKLDKMVAYAFSACRRRYLVEYFGQKPPWERCGTCDACREGRGISQGPAALAPDEELVVRKLLATVARMKTPHSPSMIARVATGSREKAVMGFGFDKLSTWGILANWSMKELEAILTALAEAGCLTVGYETRPIEGTERTYKVLSLSPLGGLVMRQQAEGFVMRFPRSAQSARPRPVANIRGVNNDLLDELKAVRARLARAADVPAYVIAPNRTLEELAKERPTSTHQLASVHGMGPERSRRYGVPFLEAIRAWTRA